MTLSFFLLIIPPPSSAMNSFSNTGSSIPYYNDVSGVDSDFSRFGGFSGSSALQGPAPLGNGNNGSNRRPFGWPDAEQVSYSYLSSHQFLRLTGQPHHHGGSGALNQSTILSNATHQELLGAGNRTYSSLYDNYIGLQNRSEIQK